MSFHATIHRVLIASPGDVGEERNVIPEILNEWNAVSAFANKKVLLPIKWETHASPLLGDRPQGIINDQIVKDCDLLVGVFWSRIGTHTGVAVSGTAEEIEQFVATGRPVMLYFSQTPIDPDKIDLEQFTVLRQFKEKMRLKGLTESYSGIADFRQKFGRQLGINLQYLSGDEKKKTAVAATVGSKAIKDVIPAVIAKVSVDDIRDYLIKAQRATANADGRSDLASLGHYLRIYTPVDHRKLGFAKLKEYLASTEMFEFESVSPTTVLVKLKQK
jgi:hypothetical protein